MKIIRRNAWRLLAPTIFVILPPKGGIVPIELRDFTLFDDQDLVERAQLALQLLHLGGLR